jgi:hypothetical protein
MTKCKRCKRNTQTYRHLDNLCPRCYLKTKNIKPAVFELGTKENPIEVRCPTCKRLAYGFVANTNNARCVKDGYFHFVFEELKCYVRLHEEYKIDTPRIRRLMNTRDGYWIDA